MRKILIVVIVLMCIVILFLVGNTVKQTVTSNKNYDSQLLNYDAQFELEPGSYIVGQDIPVGKYNVENVEGDVSLQVVYTDTAKTIEVIEGGTIDLQDGEAITVTNGSIAIKLA